jgi:hypothetical protein
MTQLTNLKSLLSGLPVTDVTTTQETAAPSTLAGVAGLATTAAGASQLANAGNSGTTVNVAANNAGAGGGSKAGGIIKAKKAKRYSVGGAVTSEMYRMAETPDGLQELQKEAQTSSSDEIRQEAARIIAEKQAGLPGAPATNKMFTAAGGGIVAFNGENQSLVPSPEGDLDPNSYANMSEPVGHRFDSALWDSIKGIPGGIANWVKEQNQPWSKIAMQTDPAAAQAVMSGNIPAGTLPSAPTNTGPTASSTPTINSTPSPAEMTAIQATGGPQRGLGGTPQARPAQPPVQAMAPAQGSDTAADVAKYFKMLSDLQGTPKDREEMAKQLKEDREEAKKTRDLNDAYSLIKAGAAMMQNTSPYAMVGLGKGVQAGAEGQMYGNKEYNDAMKQVQAGQLDLAKMNNTDRTNLIHYAVTGAESDASTRLKDREIRELAATRMQNAGQANLSRQDAAITALMKVRLGTTIAPTDQQQEDAYNWAKQKITGKSGGMSAMDQQAAAWAKANPNDPRAATILQRLGS